jgi:hypothetical protein
MTTARTRRAARPGEPHAGSKILLDAPAVHPALGYDAVAEALATIVNQSEPQFAVGIFGGWGSGKTTLMKAIRQHLVSERGVVVVEFNAWRYEREPLLLVPLLDTVRAALLEWSARRGAETREKLRGVAARIGRVVRALATGLSGEVGLPGAVKVSYDVGRALDAFGAGAEPEKAQSLYLAAFNELREAFAEFAASAVSRVVVFVDDLDRCLPANALDVLESMKLFFDLPGFVFVVGLDEDVVERAVLSRFAGDDAQQHGEPAETTGRARVATIAERLSREYVKKIFQVPYALPPVVPEQLDALLESMYSEASLSGSQLTDFQQRVRPHLEFVAVDRRVNPREVKRFLNAYTLQTLVRSDLDRDTVLAVQTLAFRYEWEDLYDLLLADSELFVDALRRYRANEESALEDLDPDLGILPADLSAYLRSPCAETLTRHPSLDAYVSSVQASTSSSHGWLVDAYRPVGRLRRELRRIRALPRLGTREGTALSEVVRDTAPYLSRMYTSESRPEVATRLSELGEQIQSRGKELTDQLARRDVSAGELDESLRAAANELYDVVERLYRELQILRGSGR